MSLSDISELGQMIGSLSNEQNTISSQLSADESDPVKTVGASESIGIKDRLIILKRKDLSDSTIWDGNNLESTWDDDTCLWDNYDDTLTSQLISCGDNTLIEHFSNTLLKDTDNTTATWAYFNTTFTAGQVLQTLPFFYDATSTIKIISATLSVTVTSGTFEYELSADGGSHWEEVTNNAQHNFSYTGSDLRIRITENGSSTGTITNMTCTYIGV